MGYKFNPFTGNLDFADTKDYHSGCYFIDTDEVVVIKEGRQSITYGELELKGEIVIKGQLIITD